MANQQHPVPPLGVTSPSHPTSTQRLEQLALEARNAKRDAIRAERLLRTADRVWLKADQKKAAFLKRTSAKPHDPIIYSHFDEAHLAKKIYCQCKATMFILIHIHMEEWSPEDSNPLFAQNVRDVALQVVTKEEWNMTLAQIRRWVGATEIEKECDDEWDDEEDEEDSESDHGSLALLLEDFHKKLPGVPMDKLLDMIEEQYRDTEPDPQEGSSSDAAEAPTEESTEEPMSQVDGEWEIPQYYPHALLLNEIIHKSRGFLEEIWWWQRGGKEDDEPYIEPDQPHALVLNQIYQHTADPEEWWLRCMYLQDEANMQAGIFRLWCSHIKSVLALTHHDFEFKAVFGLHGLNPEPTKFEVKYQGFEDRRLAELARKAIKQDAKRDAKREAKLRAAARRAKATAWLAKQAAR